MVHNYQSLLKIDNFNILIKANAKTLISVKFIINDEVELYENNLSKSVKNELLKYFCKKEFDFNKFNINLSHLSIFTQRVLLELKNINYAQLLSYKQLAQNLNSKANRAVGTALSKNPYLIILPCHRVIKSNNQIGNFTSNVKNVKEFLINFEKTKF